MSGVPVQGAIKQRPLVSLVVIVAVLLEQERALHRTTEAPLGNVAEMTALRKGVDGNI